jgi:photosystem II stability/assembly factor-like uncharacterized protein/phage pi2 protein 07
MHKKFKIMIPLALVLLASAILYLELPPTPNEALAYKEMVKQRWEQKLANKGKKKYDQPDKAMEYEVGIRSEIGKGFSYEGSWRFDAHRKAKLQLRKSAKTYEWVERGPANIGGRTRSIAIHPDDENVWFVAAVGGGVWKTTNFGESWLNVTDNLPVLSATTLAMVTSSPDVVYFGTGEGFYNADAIHGDGIFKTEDGGDTWTQLASTANNSNFRFVNRLIVHPNNENILIAATNSALFKSVDGGDSWTTVLNPSGRVQQVIANPANFNTMFATVDGDGIFATVDGDGIYKSTNMGDTWTKTSEEFFASGRIELAISTFDTTILYASAATSGGALEGFYRSSDAGEGWIDLGNSPNWLSSQGWYDNALAVSPNNPDEIIVGGVDLYRITVNDAGTSMSSEQISFWDADPSSSSYVHADQHYIYMLPGRTYRVLVANDGGIHYSADSGENWTNKNNGYNVTQFYDGDRSPLEDKYIGGTQDNGTLLSPSGSGPSSSWVEGFGADGFDGGWHKVNPDILFGSWQRGNIFRSTNGGITFSVITPATSGIFHTPFAMSYREPNTIFLGMTNGVYRSLDTGDNWEFTSVNFSSSWTVKIAPSNADPNVVWTGSLGSKVFRSTDKGQTYTEVANPVGAPNSYLTDISTSYSDPNMAYLTFGVSGAPKIFRWVNRTSSWENITGDLPDMPVHTILEMPYDSDILWAGTDIGLFISENGGTNWEYTTDNIPAVSIRRLKLFGKEIIAVTHGRGIFTTRDEQLPGYDVPGTPPSLTKPIYSNLENGEVTLGFRTFTVFDSLHMMINGEKYASEGETDAGETLTYTYIPGVDEEEMTFQVIGYTVEGPLPSEIENVKLLYPSLSHYDESFTNSQNIITDYFTVNAPSDFASGLNTSHPYEDGQLESAMLRTPIEVHSDSRLVYSDVAIIEPGLDGAFYPNQTMWDWVAVEASTDGENWSFIKEPYDARINANFLSLYNSGATPNIDDLLEHQIELSDYYEPGEIILVRFTLFADAAETGWGWYIDDVSVTTVVGVDDSPQISQRFELVGNYPNPFNPSTKIQFFLPSTQEATLQIFDINGRLVKTLFKNQVFNGGNLQSVTWNGRNSSNINVASGTYFYRLESAGKVDTRKMLLLK